MPQPALRRDVAEEAVARVEAALREGFRPQGMSGSGPGAIARAAEVWPLPLGTLQSRLRSAKQTYGLEPDETLYRAIRYQQPVPRAVLNDAPPAEPVQLRPSGEPVRVLVIGDLHQDPRHPHRMSVLTWIARYASEQRFDHIVQIGDWSTWDSVNQHDRNDTLGAKTKPPIRADMDNLRQSLQAWRTGISPGYKPRQSIVLGNHENRLERFENANPEAQGMFTRERDELFLGFGWKTRPYGELFYIQNVAFTHHPVNGAGRAFGGETGPQRAANKTTVPIVSGHTHKRQVHDSGKIGPVDVISMVEVGCALPWGEVESYAKHGITGWWHGVVPMTVQGGVITDLNFVSMLTLEREYGGQRLAA
jgi:predicted phosphodiesterase